MNTDRLLAAVHRTFGPAATYTAPAPGSAPVACAPVLNAADDTESLGSASFVVGRMTIEVLASEIAQPVKGGVFAIGAKSYRVAAAPKRIDPDNLVWTCLCDPL